LEGIRSSHYAGSKGFKTGLESQIASGVSFYAMIEQSPSNGLKLVHQICSLIRRIRKSAYVDVCTTRDDANMKFSHFSETQACICFRRSWRNWYPKKEDGQPRRKKYYPGP
jgi:hypothetical protein